MPISKVDYNTSNTVIYKIQCVDGSCDFVYFGSTTNFAKRKYSHKHDCNNEHRKQYNYNLYKTIRENKGWENFEMCLVEVYPCENKQQLVIREQFHIDSNRHDMNSFKAYSSPEASKEHRKKYMKKYNAENKEQLKENQKDNKIKYRENNKEHIAERKKKWREDNKERVLEQNKKWNQANKDRINEQRRKRRQDNKNK